MGNKDKYFVKEEVKEVTPEEEVIVDLIQEPEVEEKEEVKKVEKKKHSTTFFKRIY